MSDVVDNHSPIQEHTTMPATLTRAERRANRRAAEHANRRRERERLAAGELDLFDLPINRIDPFDPCRSGLALTNNDASPDPAGQALPYDLTKNDASPDPAGQALP